ncbi:MAG: triose-phosphate isomerase [Clostridia bacterium]|nr:triose-phosphate isomerase [Clostridia bacterium]
MRNKVIAGNWKMNHSPIDTRNFFGKFNDLVKENNHEIILCVPYIDVAAALESTENTNIKIGTQNLNHEVAGALTGDVSVKMLEDIGIKYSVIGHSERRQYHNETDDFVNLKIKAAFDHDIVPILCVGETLYERELGIAKEKIIIQIRKDLEGLPANFARKIIIAYEPIWAIGTGKTASKEDANEACKLIREEIRKMYGNDVAEEVRVLYGGSVKPTNAQELFGMSDIDGGLVGGASLEPDSFAQIANFDKFSMNIGEMI